MCLSTRTLAALLLANGMLIHADSDTVHISGKVVDASTGSGIPAAKVRVSGCKPASESDGKARYLITDENGSFELAATKDLWCEFDPSASGFGLSSDRFVAITPTESTTVTLLLNPAATVTGRIIDSQTGEPVVGVSVAALETYYLRGKRTVTAEPHRTITKEDGKFKIVDLPAAEFILELDTFKAGDSTYPRVLWPGAGHLEGVSPIAVAAGGQMDVGAIKITARKLPTLTARVVGGACRRGDLYSVLIAEPVRGTSPLARGRLSIPCGGRVTAALSPGTYRLEAESAGQSKESQEFGAAVVEMDKRDVEVEIPVSAPIPIHGEVLSERAGIDGKTPFNLASIHVFPLYSDEPHGLSPHAFPSATVDKAGLFESFYYPSPDHGMTAYVRLPRSYYVVEMRYNGRATGEEFLSDPGSPGQELEIICSPNAATIAGNVTDDSGKSVSNAKVLVIPWPSKKILYSYPADVIEAAVDAVGNFSFPGLHPGKYRVIAAHSEDRKELEAPGVLLDAFGRSETVEVGEGGFANELLKPWRK